MSDKWIEWIYVEDRLPKKSGIYYCQVSPWPFETDKSIFYYWLSYSKKTGWDTMDRMGVVAWTDSCEKRKTSEVY